MLINSFMLTCREILSGVPHGSLINPVLFNIFTNDLAESIERRFIKLVDNVKLGGTGNTKK